MTDSDRAIVPARSDRHGNRAEAVTNVLVTAHASAPGRTVLTEVGNTDAWIASDLAFDLAD